MDKIGGRERCDVSDSQTLSWVLSLTVLPEVLMAFQTPVSFEILCFVMYYLLWISIIKVTDFKLDWA